MNKNSYESGFINFIENKYQPYAYPYQLISQEPRKNTPKGSDDPTNNKKLKAPSLSDSEPNEISPEKVKKESTSFLKPISTQKRKRRKTKSSSIGKDSKINSSPKIKHAKMTSRSNYADVDQKFQKPMYQHCGVPNCHTHHLFQIPKSVRDNPDLLQKWSRLVCLEKESSPSISFQGQPSNQIEIEETNPLTDAEDDESIPHQGDSQVTLSSCVVSSSFHNMDNKLKALTGLDDKISLDALVNESIKSGVDKIAMRKRIILTLCKLKTNREFEPLAALFGTNYKTILSYFADTIKHLAEVFYPLINIATHDPNIMLNKMTAFETIAIGTEPQLEVLVGVSPSGLINYVSPMSNVGIEMVTPKIYAKQHRISALHLRKHIEKLKTFKFFSETIEAALVPFIDDIMIVLCGLLNNSLLFNQDKTLVVC